MGKNLEDFEHRTATFEFGLVTSLCLSDDKQRQTKTLEKKNRTVRKRPTMAIRLGFLIKFSLHYLVSSFIGIPNTNPYILLAFPHTELGEPVQLKLKLPAQSFTTFSSFV